MLDLTYSYVDSSPPPGEGFLYQQGFTTDRSADFDNPSGWDWSAVAYDAAGTWLGDTTVGVMHFGQGETGIISRTITFDVTVAEIEIYTSILTGSWGGGAGTATLRLYLSWLDAGNSLVGSEITLSTSATGHLSYVQARPSGATQARLRFERRGSSGDLELGVFYLHVLDTADGASPVATGLRPDLWALRVGAADSGGGGQVYDFADAWEGIDSIEIVQADTAAGASVAGTELTLAPATGIAIPATAAGANASLVSDVFVRGKAGARTALSSLQVYVWPSTYTAVAARTVNAGSTTYRCEAGQFVVIDPMSYTTADDTGTLQGSTCVVTAKPAWLTEAQNGLLYGLATGSGAQTSVVATVTDAEGNTVEVTIPITIFSVSRASPTTISQATSEAAGGLRNAITINGSGPTVVQLVDGDTYQMGTWFNVNQDSDKPIVIMGPATGMAEIRVDTGGFFLNNTTGIWFEGNITFSRQTLPADIASLGERTTPDMSMDLADGNVIYTPNRFTDVTIEGHETDLSNESSWRIYENGSGDIFYESTLPSATGTLPTTGRYSRAIYKGGIEISGQTILQGVTISKAGYGIIFSGCRGAGAYGVRVDSVRVDVMRASYSYGVVVQDLRFGDGAADTWCNCRSDEHQDGFQTIADASLPCGRRYLLKDCFIHGAGSPNQQALQCNMGSAGSPDPYDPPDLWLDDFRVEDCLLTGTNNNGFNGQYSRAELIRTVIIFDPALVVTTGSTTSGGDASAIVRKFDRASYTITGCILNRINDEGVPRIPWTVTDTLDFYNDVGAPAKSTVFPNIATGPTYTDPRTAVDNSAAASSARFAITDGGAWDLANPDKGPSWLRDGVYP